MKINNMMFDFLALGVWIFGYLGISSLALGAWVFGSFGFPRVLVNLL